MTYSPFTWIEDLGLFDHLPDYNAPVQLWFSFIK